MKKVFMILATVVAMTTLVACGDKEQTNAEPSVTGETNESNESTMSVEPRTEDVESVPLKLELYSSRRGTITYYDRDNFFSKCVEGTTANIKIEFAGNNKKYE